MPTLKKENSIDFSLKGIEILSFNLTQPVKISHDSINYNFDIRSEIKLNNEQKLVLVIISIDLFEQEKTIKLGGISTSCIFEVLDYNMYVDLKNNKVNFPNDFIIAINSISLSTTRGILFSQFRGTYLHNAVLPLIDPKSFITPK
jgi:hypothetical protein